MATVPCVGGSLAVGRIAAPPRPSGSYRGCPHQPLRYRPALHPELRRLSQQESRQLALPVHKKHHVLEHFRWSATWSALMLHQQVAMRRQKILCADSVDLMASGTAKEMDLAVALIAMKIANQQRRSRQQGLQQPLNRRNQRLRFTPPRASLIRRVNQEAVELADQSAVVPTVRMSSLRLASLFSRRTGNISTWIFGSTR